MYNQVSNGALLPSPDITVWILQLLQAGVDLKKFPASCPQHLFPPHIQPISNQLNVPEFDWSFAPHVKIGEALACARYRLIEAGMSTQSAYQDAIAILDAVMQQSSNRDSNFFGSTLTEKQAKLYKEKLVDRINGKPLDEIIEELKQVEIPQG